MSKVADSIEVFQDLFLTCSDESRSRLREALLQHTRVPWRHAEELEKKIQHDGHDVMAFERESGDSLPPSRLVLWEEAGGYKVTNIVPLENGELGVTGYNDALNDFKDRIVTPASMDSGFSVKITPREQSIADWTSKEAADALHRFSGGANKFTGSGHPSDRKRWLEFLMSAYKSKTKLDPELLERWLVEVEEWPPDVASRLVIQYEFGLDLLNEYDCSC